MKNLIKYGCYTLLSFVFACSPNVKECKNRVKGTAILTHYRIAKHSHMWFKNPKTGIVYDVGALGGRREPNIKIGTEINVDYCDGEIIFDRYKYVKQPTNRTTRYVYE